MSHHSPLWAFADPVPVPAVRTRLPSHTRTPGAENVAPTSHAAGFSHCFSDQSLWHGLRIADRNDPLEQEADRTADSLVSGAAPSLPQARSAPPDEEVFRSPAVSAENYNEGYEDGGGAAFSSPEGRTGQTLPAEPRREFETRLGRSLDDVRIHTDAQAAVESRALNARAFAQGRDISFAAGEYRPDTSHGRWLLAHEIAHTQQAHPGVITRYAADAPLPAVPQPPTPTARENPEIPTGNPGPASRGGPPPPDEPSHQPIVDAVTQADPPANEAPLPAGLDADRIEEDGATVPVGASAQLPSRRNQITDTDETATEDAAPQADIGALEEQLLAPIPLHRRRLAQLSARGHATVSRAASATRAEITAKAETARSSVTEHLTEQLEAMTEAAVTTERQVDVAQRAHTAGLEQTRLTAVDEMTGIFTNHRNAITRMVDTRISDANTERVTQGNRLRQRTTAQAREAELAGLHRADGFPNDDRGAYQGGAVETVADRVASEVRDRQPEALDALNEICGDLATSLRDAGRQALEGFDAPLPDLLANIAQQATDAGGILAEQATNSSTQLGTFTETARTRLQNRGNEALLAVDTTMASALAQVTAAEQAALRDLDRSIYAIRETVIGRLHDDDDLLVTADDPDPDETAAWVQDEVDASNSAIEQTSERVPATASEMAQRIRSAATATGRELRALEAQFDTDARTVGGGFSTDLINFETEVDQNFGSTVETLYRAYTENEVAVRADLATSADRAETQFNQGSDEATRQIRSAVQGAIELNDRALAELPAKMDEAAELTAWNYDHPVRAYFHRVLGILVGILAALALIVVFIIAFKISIILGVILVIVAVVAFIIYPMISAWRQGRLTWGFVGDMALNILGINDIIRSFRDPTLTPFEQGFHFGFGVTNLVLFVYSAGRGLRGLPGAFRALRQSPGALTAAIGRIPATVARGLSREGIARRTGALGGQFGRIATRIGEGDLGGAFRATRSAFSSWEGNPGGGRPRPSTAEPPTRPPSSSAPPPPEVAPDTTIPPESSIDPARPAVEPPGTPAASEPNGAGSPPEGSGTVDTGTPPARPPLRVVRPQPAAEPPVETPNPTRPDRPAPRVPEADRPISLDQRRTPADRAAVQRRLHNRRVMERSEDTGPTSEGGAQQVPLEGTTGRPIDVGPEPAGSATEPAAPRGDETVASGGRRSPPRGPQPRPRTSRATSGPTSGGSPRPTARAPRPPRPNAPHPQTAEPPSAIEPPQPTAQPPQVGSEPPGTTPQTTDPVAATRRGFEPQVRLAQPPRVFTTQLGEVRDPGFEGKLPGDNPLGVGGGGNRFAWSLANLRRMLRGYAPRGIDGEPINLHHRAQGPRAPLDEYLATMHREQGDLMHQETGRAGAPPRPNVPRVGQPASGAIDRPEFDWIRSRHWISRARAYLEGLVQRGQATVLDQNAAPPSGE